MPNEISFSSDRAHRILGCFSDIKPIPPAGEKWTFDDMLMLAGVCIAGAECLRTVQPMSGEVASQTDVVRLYAKLTREVILNKFDEKYCLPTITGVFCVDADGLKPFKVTDGQRDFDKRN